MQHRSSSSPRPSLSSPRRKQFRQMASAAAPSGASDHHSARVQLSAVVLISYSLMGIAESVLGPTLPELALESNQQVSLIANAVTAFMLGNSAGSLLGGSLFDRFTVGQVARMCAVCLLGNAAINALLPVAGHWQQLAALSLVNGVCSGFFRTGSNWLLLRTWAARQAGPFLQALHFGSGFGRLAAGLIATRSLAVGKLRWAFWVPSILLSLAALGLAVVPTPPPLGAPKYDSSEQQQAADAALCGWDFRRTRVMAALSLFTMLTMGVQNAFQFLLAAYAVLPPLHFDPSKAALLSTAFSGAFALGRLLAVPTAVRYASSSMLLGCCLGVALSVLAMQFFIESSTVLWLSAVTVGISISPVFPSTLACAGQLIGTGSVSGVQLSVLMFAGTLGGAGLPLLVGKYLDAVSSNPKLMVSWLLACAAGALGVLYVLLGGGEADSPAEGTSDDSHEKEQGVALLALEV